MPGYKNFPKTRRVSTVLLITNVQIYGGSDFGIFFYNEFSILSDLQFLVILPSSCCHGCLSYSGWVEVFCVCFCGVRGGSFVGPSLVRRTGRKNLVIACWFFLIRSVARWMACFTKI